ncbi:DUF6234 family protein [Streptomyces sp. NPDC054887]
MPAELSPQEHPVSGWGDAALALFVLVTDAAACFTAVILLWGRGAGEVAALITFGALAAAAGLTAYGFGNGGRVITAWVQSLAALLLGASVLYGAAGAYADAHPEPAPARTSDPGRTGHQCRSGGDSSECADSGG